MLAFSDWLGARGDVRTGDSFFSLTAQERQGLGLNLCGAAKLTCCVGPEGERVPVRLPAEPSSRPGRCGARSFQDIWDASEVFASFRGLRIRSCEECHRFDQCHGGCPAVAYHIARGSTAGTRSASSAA